MKDKELSITAALACMELSEEETQRLGKEVSGMLEYFSKMMEVDTSDLEPTTHALLRNNRTRPDVNPNNNKNNNNNNFNNTNGNNNPDRLIDNAPETEDRFIVIPNVL